jgi:hypothetical protein
MEQTYSDKVWYKSRNRSIQIHHGAEVFREDSIISRNKSIQLHHGIEVCRYHLNWTMEQTYSDNVWYKSRNRGIQMHHGAEVFREDSIISRNKSIQLHHGIEVCSYHLNWTMEQTYSDNFWYKSRNRGIQMHHGAEVFGKDSIISRIKSIKLHHGIEVCRYFLNWSMEQTCSNNV